VSESAGRTAFTSEQYANPYPDGIESHYWSVARSRIVRRHLEEDLAAVPRTEKLLEIGCGRGVVVDHLRRQGFDAWGCDIGQPTPISPGVAPYLRLGCDAFTLDETTRASFRTIVLLDVLEHLEEPTAFLLECREAFRSCSGMLVTLPARMEIWSNYDEYYGHFRRYDRDSVSTMIPPETFEIVRRSYFFHALYVPARLLSALGRKRATTIAAPSARTRWLHRLLGSAFEVEERLLPQGLPGTSILAVLRVRR
jgi:hypothetical protein